MLALLLALGASASSGLPPPDVVQLEDGRLTCGQVVAQVNGLSRDMAERQRGPAGRMMAGAFAAERAERATKAAAGIASTAVPYGMGATVNNAADRAAEAARDVAVQKDVSAAAGEMPALHAEQQRMEHLEKLAIDKGC